MKKTLLTLAGLVIWLCVLSQPAYYMNNQTVDDCEGILFDSEAGDPAGNYAHNENFTFVICVPGADIIHMNFLNFCTELLFDSLRIFDGPDTLSPQIGMTYSGQISIPPVQAFSGCLTLHFSSDPSVNCTGWEAHWETEVIPPQPPPFLPIPNLPCESNQITLQLAEPVPCDSIVPGAFSISGPMSPSVITATPVNCMNGMTSQFILTFEPPINISGNYVVSFTYSETVCNQVFSLTSYGDFAVTDCPLFVQLYLDGSINCIGDEAWLVAEASGGNPAGYAYAWSPPLPPQSNVLISPVVSSTYTVTVTDGTGASAVASLMVNPNPLPVITPVDTTVCQSADAFFFSASPPGGIWSGRIILCSLSARRPTLLLLTTGAQSLPRPRCSSPFIRLFR